MVTRGQLNIRGQLTTQILTEIRANPVPLKDFLSMIGLSFRLSYLPTALRTSVEAKFEPLRHSEGPFSGSNVSHISTTPTNNQSPLDT